MVLVFSQPTRSAARMNQHLDRQPKAAQTKRVDVTTTSHQATKDRSATAKIAAFLRAQNATDECQTARPMMLLEMKIRKKMEVCRGCAMSLKRQRPISRSAALGASHQVNLAGIK